MNGQVVCRHVEGEKIKFLQHTGYRVKKIQKRRQWRFTLKELLWTLWALSAMTDGAY
jgi:hypothetical protein